MAPRLTRPELPNFDDRSPAPAGSLARAAALTKIQAAIPGIKVDQDRLFGSSVWVTKPGGFLTGPGGGGTAISPATLASFSATDSNRVTKAFLREHSSLFGHGPEALANARVKRDLVAPGNGLHSVIWEQQVDGIPVFEALLISHTSRRGELVSLSSHFVPDPVAAAAGAPNRAALLAAPPIGITQALSLAARNVGEVIPPAGFSPAGADGTPAPDRQRSFIAPGLKGPADARLVWLPMTPESLRLCWQITLMSRARGEMFLLLVDASSGVVHLRRSLTVNISDVSYRVFTSDSPTPLSPGLPAPTSDQPLQVDRVLVVTNAFDTNASPAGWINDGDNETVGNNVDAHLDRNADNIPDLPRPQGSPFRVFDPSLDLTQDPSLFGDAAVVNLFFRCNWMHDQLYGLGFTEAAGNFQVDNFGRGGVGGDPVQADAQDGSGYNNANFSTPPDGLSGRMQMYLFPSPSPARDGDYDAQVICHEYTHGLSNRLIGGGAGISALQPSGMGEGWSDFYSLSLLSKPDDDVNGNYPLGAYVIYQLSGLTQNYYFGIRRYPYTTDLSRNPLTLKDIDPTQISSHPGVPSNPIFAFNPSSASEVHNQGEVWCVTLWDARASFINKYGYAVGNHLILQVVTDAMVLTPANPTFLQARDAILLADEVDNAGANQVELWAAFAKRGMGVTASVPDSSTTTGVVESFEAPGSLSVTPFSPLVFRGPVGGPFAPLYDAWTLTNVGASIISWTASPDSGWFDVSPTAGALFPAGLASPVVAAPNASANALASGVYSGTVTFTEQPAGSSRPRPVQLLVGLADDSFTEQFNQDNFDLAFTTLTFTPNGSLDYYAVCREPAPVFPTDPAGGTTLGMGDDTAAQVTLTGTNSVSIYGIPASVFYVGSNGYLTFYFGDTQYIESFGNHFILPRVSALYHDLNPGAAGTVSWKQLADRVAVTFQGVPAYGSADPNDFQMELFFDGRIRLTWLAINCLNSLVGLSQGYGVPPAFSPSDLSTNTDCSLLRPAIFSQPKGLTNMAGGSATFNVGVTGAPSLAYQWQFLGTNLAGATGPSLGLSPLNTNESGPYSVVVTNLFGSAFSSNAFLRVVASNAMLAIFADPAFVDTTSGGTAAEAVNVQGSLGRLALPFVTFTNLAAATTNFARILIPELELGDLASALSPATRAALAGFVANGGSLTVFGDANGNVVRLLDAVFGFSVVESSQNGGGLVYVRGAPAAVTPFAGGPATITGNNGTSTLAVNSLPPGAFSIYENSGQSAVALLPYGAGAVVFLGWDWNNAAPIGSADNGWLAVLGDNALAPLLPPPPLLGAQAFGNVMLLSWPAGLPFVLETTSPDLIPPTWVPVDATPVQIGDSLVVPMNMTDSSRYFRLRWTAP